MASPTQTTTAQTNRIQHPITKPNNPNFSSGPCSKRPGYSLTQLNTQLLGRSHRSAISKQALAEVVEKSKQLLRLPEDYLLGIVPGSDTGAFEMAMWNFLEHRPVDIFHWESFGSDWFTDISKQLKLQQVNNYHADYGLLPDLSKANPEHDCVFTWNGTTSGVCVPNASWISDERKGLTLCDATSAVFSMDIDWPKIDVATFSWQKALGGEAAHGVLVLSPRALERLENQPTTRPLPKIFQLTKNGKLNRTIFDGVTINTPSMLCVADCLDALNWVSELGGLDACIQRSQQSFDIINAFVSQHSWIDFLAQNPSQRSTTSVCLTLDLSAEQINQMVTLLAEQQVAFDINAYPSAPASIRIWCGATIDSNDVNILMPWIAWAYHHITNNGD